LRIKHCLTALAGCLLLTVFQSFTAFAEVDLPPGAVKGLPEQLAALDNEGKSVNSATGEYFFRVDDMKYGEIYTKKVQLMNLREDFTYHIYFYVEPLQKSGSIDLEKGCECVFWLDGREFYRGSVTGNGNFDLTAKYYDCGLFYPGDSHVLSCSVVWNDLDVLDNVNVDNGHRLVDQNGTHVLEGSNNEDHVEGEIEFKWIFAARVNPNDYEMDSQSTTTNNGGRETMDFCTSTSANENIKNTVDTGTTANADSKQTVDSHTNPRSNVESTMDVRYTTTTTTTTTTVAVTIPVVPEEQGNANSPPDPGKSGQPSIPANPDVPESPNPPGGNNPNHFFSPFTGYLVKNGTVWLVIMGGVSVGIIVLLILICHEKKKRKKKT